MAVGFDNPHEEVDISAMPAGTNDSSDEIATINARILGIKRNISELVAELNEGRNACEDAKLLLTYSSLGFHGNVELERLYRVLLDRNAMLVKYLQMSREDTLLHVDDIHESIILSEILDDSWLNELNLRHLLDDKTVSLTSSEAKIKEQSDAIARLSDEEAILIQQRKKYSVDIAAENQSILKFKARYEELSHHLNTFATGSQFVNHKFTPSSSQTVPLAEQMRCSFNELRRVNSSLEEKLVITGVSKQKTMKELKAVLTEIRASCSRNPTKFRAVSEDILDDPNLSSHTLRDIGAVWKAALPSVPSLSGDPLHGDLLTWLSVSMGHFCEEYLCDLADVALTNKIKQGKKGTLSGTHVEEEAKLVGVVSVETERYRSISGALAAAVHDAQELLDNDHCESVQAVVENACERIKSRLGVRQVTFWRISDDKSHALGFVSDHSEPVKLKLRNDFSERLSTPPLFERSLRVTCSVERLDLESPAALPADIAVLSTTIQKRHPEERFDAFSVSSSSGGLTVIRGDSDDPFQAFSGIYCEQFYRRINSAIAPLQLIHVKEIGNQRPLTLVQCLFELREKGNNPHLIWRLASQHLQLLFRATNLSFFITLDSDPSHLIRIGHGETSLDGFMDDYPELFLAEATRGMSLIDTPATVAEVIKTNASVVLEPQNCPSEMSAFITESAQTIHLRPISKGRSVVFVVCWCDSSSARPPDDGLDDSRVWKETFFNPDSASQKLILSTYLGLVESMLGRFFGQTNTGFASDATVESYQVELERDRIEISKLVEDFS